MRKATKVFLIIATVCVIVGVATATTAFALAGFNPQVLSTEKPKTQEHYTASSDEIDSIGFTGVEDNLQIVRGDVQSIEVDYWHNDTHPYKITQDDSSKQLNISLDYSWSRQLFNLDWFHFEFPLSNHTVIITVPESYDGSLLLTTVSGSVVLDENINELDILKVKTVSGHVDYSLQKARYVEVETISGSISGSIADAADTATFNTVSADVNLEFGSVHSLTAQTVSGAISVYALDNPAYKYSFNTQTLSGSINVPASSSGAENNVIFNTVSGNINFDFVKKLNPPLIN